MYLYLTKQLKLVVLLVTVAVVGFCLYRIIDAVYAYQTTGLLALSVNDDNAVITVSGPDTTATIIGTGNTKARLKPGSYLVFAADKGKQTSQVVQVSLKQTSKTSLDINDTHLLPSIYNVNFTGMDSLLDKGITIEQVTNLKQGLYSFNNKAKTIAVNDDTIMSGPRDPNSLQGFSMTFTVTMGGSTYNAVMKYGLGDDIYISLTDPQTNTQVYNRHVATPV